MGNPYHVLDPLDLAESSFLLPRPHLSPSQVIRYQECAACYEEEFVNGKPRKLNIALPLGSGVHAGIAHARREALEGKRVLNMAEVLDAGLDRYAMGVLGHDPLDPDPPKAIDPDWSSDDIGKAQDHVREILNQHTVPLTHRDIEAGIVEVEAEVDYDGVWPFPFKGFLDLRVRDGIVDLKTSARKGVPPLSTAFQVACYGLPEWVRTGTIVGLGIDKIVKTVTSQHQYFAVQAGGEELRMVYHDVLQVASDISAGRFPVGQGRYGVHDYEHGRPVAYFVPAGDPE